MPDIITNPIVWKYRKRRITGKVLRMRYLIRVGERARRGKSHWANLRHWPKWRVMNELRARIARRRQQQCS